MASLTNARDIINRSRATTGAAGIDILKFPSDIDNIPHKFIMNFKKRNTTISMTDFGAAVRADSNIRAAIALPVPIDIAERFDLTYKTENLGAIGETIRSLAAAGASSSRIGEAVVNFGTQAASGIGSIFSNTTSTDAILSVVGGIAAAFRGDNILGAAGDIARIAYPGLTVGIGAIANPYTTAIFGGVKLRKNDFSWLLAPANETESESLEDIIRTIRYYMLPTKNLITLNYPDEVEYTITGMTEKYKIPTKPCVVESFTVQRTPIKEAGPAFFAKTGAPAFIELKLSLLEVTPIYRDDLREAGVGPEGAANINIPPASQTPTANAAPLIGAAGRVAGPV